MGVWDLEPFEYVENNDLSARLGLDLIKLDEFDFKLPSPQRDNRYAASRFMGAVY